MRRLITLLVFLVMLAAAIVAVAPYLIGTETFKKQLTEKLNKATGYEISIGGRIQIKLFPSIGARLEKISIHTSSASMLPLITAASVVVDVELLPLLHKEIVVKRLALRDPEINLVIDGAGRGNWQMSAAAPSAPAETAPATPPPSPLPEDFLLHDVSIENGRLVYNNEQTKQQWIINNLNLNAALSESMRLVFSGNGEWKSQAVKMDASIDTLDNFLKGDTAKIRGNIKSDLLELDINGAWERDAYTGPVNAKIISIRDFLSWVSPKKPASAQVLPSFFSISGNARCGAEICHIPDSAIALDTIKAAGSVKAAWGGSVPQLELDLKAGQVDMNLFLPAEKIQVSGRSPITPAIAAPGGEWSRDPIDLSALSALNAMINLKADSLLIRNIFFEKAVIAAKLHNGRLSFNVPDADFYNGKFSLNADMEMIGKSLTFEGHWRLKGVQIGPLFKDALDDDRLSGTLDFSLDSERSGQSMYDLIYGVSGKGQIHITDGAFKGFNIAEMARNIEAAFKPQPGGGIKRTDFSEVTGSFTIVQGVVSSDDLTMKSPFLRVTGKGQISLPLATIDARLLPQFVDTAQGQGGKDKQALLAVPIVVEGPLKEPVFRPDVKSIVKDAIQNPDKVKEQIKSGKDALKNLLRKF